MERSDIGMCGRIWSTAKGCLGAIYDGTPEKHRGASEPAPDRTIEGSTVAEASHQPNLIDGDHAGAKQASRKRQLV
jgi:hypothetical protein